MQQKAERAYLLQIGLLLCFDEQQPPLQQDGENAPICCKIGLLLRVDWGPPFPMQQKAERAYLLQIGLLASLAQCEAKVQ